ncbi:MAG: ABC transporter ATP-binding protein [Opitutae bacterium]|nr:ABC transporter ATP-binding protein [Opitutae bacterium]
MNIIETNRLTRRFWRTEAVHDLTLTVPEGSVTALLGPNGAGKTTTLKLLMNLLTPTAGTARVFGVDSRLLGERERAQIGYVSENQQLPDWMTVRQLLDYCRPFYPGWDRTLETQLLQRFDLPPERKLKQLSRGMRMKAALLSSLAYRPRLIVLDEPFSGLDPLVRDDFVRGILEVSAQGDWTVLISSHDIEEVERLADRIAVLDAGRLQFAEPTEALLNRFRRVEVSLPRAVSTSGDSPADWLELEQQDGLVRFVTSQYHPDETEQLCRARYPEATVTVRAMALREIFIVQARGGHRTEKGILA